LHTFTLVQNMSNNLSDFTCLEHLSVLSFPFHTAECNPYVYFNRFSSFIMLTFSEARNEN